MTAPPRGGQFPLHVIVLAVQLVRQTGSSLRGAAAVLALFARHAYLSGPTPAASTVRSWLLRIGYARLKCPLPPSGPWVWLIDHTLQIGEHKLFVIVGCPLDAVPFGVRPLALTDLHLIALVPMTSSNQERVERELERAVARTGVPRQIICDGAADLHKGIERFRARHPQTVATTDAVHHAANLLKHYWDKDPRWQEFTRRMHQTATVIRQSRAAHLLAPKLRNKARFMSVGVFVRFGRLLLRQLQATPPRPEVVQHYAWVAEFARELAAWQEQQDLVQTFLQYVRVEGLHAAAKTEVEAVWEKLGVSAHPTTHALRHRLAGYLGCAGRGLSAEERFVGSTEVLESAFGVQKRLSGDQRESGLTGLTLALGALLGEPTAATLAADLAAVPEKAAESWARRWLGPTVQWLRRQFFGSDPLQCSAPPTVPNPG